MGHRANFVVVEHGRAELFYSHWAAISLTRDLFDGPAAAVDYIRRCEPTREWLDDVWCEGAALVDLDRRVLLIFGGDDLKYELPMRRVYLELLRLAWEGFEVRWAEEELCTLVDHLGLSRDLVRATPRDVNPVTDLECSPEWVEVLLSLRDEAGALFLCSSQQDLDDLASAGPPVLDLLRKNPPLSSLTVPASEFPRAGIHTDLRSRTLEVWLGESCPDVWEMLKASWPGWTIVPLGDRFEVQVERCGGALKLETESRDKLLRRVVAHLTHSPAKSPVQGFREIIAMHEAKGEKVEQVNPHALKDLPPPAPLEERKRVLARVLAKVEGGLGALHPKDS